MKPGVLSGHGVRQFSGVIAMSATKSRKATHVSKSKPSTSTQSNHSVVTAQAASAIAALRLIAWLVGWQ